MIEAYRRLTHDVVAFDVRLDEPLDFEAGQFALLTVPGIAGARAYSMVNFDRRAECLSFVVKKKPDGAVSDWLFRDARRGHRASGSSGRWATPRSAPASASTSSASPVAAASRA